MVLPIQMTWNEYETRNGILESGSIVVLSLAKFSRLFVTYTNRDKHSILLVLDSE